MPLQATIANLEKQLREACAELDRRLRAGEACTAESLLAARPELAGDTDRAVELIYTEFVTRRELGQEPVPAEWYARFPQWRAPLEALFQVDALVHPGDTPHSLASERTVVLPPARRAGGFTILGELGRGGMGVVYKARQESLGRLVALKMILAGEFAGGEDHDRFRREAEAAACLQHPNIVQIYEVGELDGRPYLAMELVEGTSLDSLLLRTPLPAADAAQLIETLARAMHYAHQRGVIHRDLKPANILLQRIATDEHRSTQIKKEEEGVCLSSISVHQCSSVADSSPKIADFGLAKRLDAPGLTATGAILGTPSYMAPEQAEGRTHAIGPAVDVYALGVILYEALTGQKPFKAITPLETLQLVVSQEPVPPSRLQPKVPRDLETICLKCLHKQPRKRYPSAEALAEDLRLWQEGKPIQARPVGLWERGVKWVRRRPAAAALLAVIVLAALGGAAGAVGHIASMREINTQLRTTNEELTASLDNALEQTGDLLADVGLAPLIHAPGMDRVRRRLLETARRHLDWLIDRRGADAALRERIGLLYQRVGQLHGAVGLSEEALDIYRAGVQHFEQLLTTHPEDPTCRQWLALHRHNLARLLADLGQRDEAERTYRLAETEQAKLVDEFPDEPRYRKDLAQNRMNLGAFLKDADPVAAEKLLGDALRIRERLAADPANHPTAQYDLAQNHNELAVLLRGQRKGVEVEQHYRAAIALQEPLAAKYLAVADYREALARSHSNLANYLTSKDPVAAEAHYRAACEGRAWLATRFPERHASRHQLAITQMNLTNLLAAAKRLKEAEEFCTQALSTRLSLAQQFYYLPDYVSGLALVLHKAAELAYRQKNWTKAAPLLREAVAQQTKALMQRPGHIQYLEHLRDHYGLWAHTLVALGDHAEAARAAEQLAKVSVRRSEDLYNAARCAGNCIRLAEKDKRLSPDERSQQVQVYGDQAVVLLREAIQLGLKDRGRLKTDKAFQALQERKDFQELRDGGAEPKESNE